MAERENAAAYAGRNKRKAKKRKTTQRRIEKKPLNGEKMSKKQADDQQWYEKDPSLLEAEKAAMAKMFPNFKLEQLGNGRLAWTGTLTPGLWRGLNASEDDLTAKQTWEVKAIYENNHPSRYSVKVFLVNPTIDTVIKETGWVPSPFNNYDYLCEMSIGKGDFTSAPHELYEALSWLQAFELVMIGELTKEEFNEALERSVNRRC